MTSLLYLLNHHLYVAINSNQCRAEDWRASLYFFILTWPFNTWVAKYTDRCLNSDMVNPWGSKMDQIFQVKSTSSACMHTCTQLRRSPVPCAPSTLGPRQLFFLCWPGSPYGPGLGWRASGGALFLSGPLTHTQTQTHSLTHSIMLFYPHAARQVTLLLRWVSEDCSVTPQW